jgi:hypothetical protein
VRFGPGQFFFKCHFCDLPPMSLFVEILNFHQPVTYKKLGGQHAKRPQRNFFLKKIDQCHDHNIFQVENSQTTRIKKFNKN